MKRQRAGPLITEERIVFAEACTPPSAPRRRLRIDFPTSRVAQAGPLCADPGLSPPPWVPGPEGRPAWVSARWGCLRSVLVHSTRLDQASSIRGSLCGDVSPYPHLATEPPSTLLGTTGPGASGQAHGQRLILCGLWTVPASCPLGPHPDLPTVWSMMGGALRLAVGVAPFLPPLSFSPEIQQARRGHSGMGGMGSDGLAVPHREPSRPPALQGDSTAAPGPGLQESCQHPRPEPSLG